MKKGFLGRKAQRRTDGQGYADRDDHGGMAGLLKKFEGDDGAEPPEKVNFGESSECRIYYGGIHVLREYINIVLKDGEEIDGSRTAWEKGQFSFYLDAPTLLNILFDALAKGADWVHYFEDSYREKWQSEKPDIDYDECECLGGNGMSPGDYFSIRMMIILIGNRLLSLKMGGLGTLKAYILKPVTGVTLPFATRRETGFDSIPCPMIIGKFLKGLPRTVKSNLYMSTWYPEMSSI